MPMKNFHCCTTNGSDTGATTVAGGGCKASFFSYHELIVFLLKLQLRNISRIHKSTIKEIVIFNMIHENVSYRASLLVIFSNTGQASLTLPVPHLQ